MPKFTYQKESNNEGKDTLGDSGYVQNRHHTFTADDKILKKMKVGEEIKLVLKGRVVETIDVDSKEQETYRTTSFEVNVDSYQVYPENEFTKLLDDEDD